MDALIFQIKKKKVDQTPFFSSYKFGFGTVMGLGNTYQNWMTSHGKDTYIHWTIHIYAAFFTSSQIILLQVCLKQFYSPSVIVYKHDLL